MALTPELRQQLREKAQKVAVDMPPLTPPQIARLRVLLRGTRS
jgi:hypothetical protein